MRKNVIDNLIAWGNQRGIDLPRPARSAAERLSLPDDLTALDLDALGRLYWQCGQEASYLGGEVCLQESQHQHLKSEYDRQFAATCLEISKNKPRNGRGVEGGKASVESEALLDPELVQLVDELDEANARVKFLRAAHEGARRAQANISREFSRRGFSAGVNYGDP